MLVKVAIVLFFIAVGAFFIRPTNYTGHGGFAPNGFAGISAAAAIIFFAYIGFDAVSTRITSYNVCYTKLLRLRQCADPAHRVVSPVRHIECRPDPGDPVR